MSKLSLLEKNAYLSIVIKDNGIWSHLAYTDHNAGREYILSDYSDISSLRTRLDDETFSKIFWLEYFENLEKAINWNIVDRNSLAVFTFRKFQTEGDGLSGIRIQVDDNQKFLTKIFASIRDFSRDISIRIIDDLYIQTLLDSLVRKSEYDDIIYIDMDLMDFSVFRIKKVSSKANAELKTEFTKSKLSWGDEKQLIECVQDSRFNAFLATDLDNREVLNYWSNFVLNRVCSSDDANLKDILRAYSTVQNHSVYRDNKEKIEGFGILPVNSAVIISGYIPRILGKSSALLTVIDGLELSGNFDCYWDLDQKLISYGMSYIHGIESMDIILTRKEVLSLATKVYIPLVKQNLPYGKMLVAGKIQGLGLEDAEFFIQFPEYGYVEIPKHAEKLIVEGECKNGASILPDRGKYFSFISSPGSCMYESMLFDCRPRPVVYGPDTYSNKLKLQTWIK